MTITHKTFASYLLFFGLVLLLQVIHYVHFSSVIGAEIIGLPDNAQAAASQAGDSAATSAGLLRIQSHLLFGLGITLLAGLAGFVGIRHPLKGFLRETSSTLDDIAGKMDGTTYHVRTTSYSLADVVSRKATALAQMVSSLQGIAARTTSNAGDAQQADSRIQEVTSEIELAQAVIARLSQSMQDISSASGEASRSTQLSSSPAVCSATVGACCTSACKRVRSRCSRRLPGTPIATNSQPAAAVSGMPHSIWPASARNNGRSALSG